MESKIQERIDGIECDEELMENGEHLYYNRTIEDVPGLYADYKLGVVFNIDKESIDYSRIEDIVDPSQCSSYFYEITASFSIEENEDDEDERLKRARKC
jgi:hypothetical protein